jgi:hypothetical protein
MPFSTRLNLKPFEVFEVHFPTQAFGEVRLPCIRVFHSTCQIDDSGALVRLLVGDSIRQATRRLHVAPEYVRDGITNLLALIMDRQDCGHILVVRHGMATTPGA